MKPKKDKRLQEWDNLRDKIEFGATTENLTEYSRRELRSYQPRLTALVDLIGFGAMVPQMRQEGTRIRLIDALRKLTENRSSTITNADLIVDQRVMCFSDLVVISYPHYSSDYIKYLLWDVIVLTSQMIELGLSLRGAIVLAPLYQTPGIIAGEALVEAYDMEHTKAIYPRVILSPQVVRASLGLAESCSDRAVEKWIEAGVADAHAESREYTEAMSLVAKDRRDTYYYVDHLHASPRYRLDPVAAGEHRDYLLKVRALIASQLELAIRSDLPIAERRKRQRKWSWYAQYLNRAAARVSGVAALPSKP